MLNQLLSWKKSVESKIAVQQNWTKSLSRVLLDSYQQNMFFVESLLRLCRRLLCPYWRKAFRVFRVLTSLDVWSPKGVNCWEKFGCKKHQVQIMRICLLWINRKVNYTSCLEIWYKDSQDTNLKNHVGEFRVSKWISHNGP